MAAPARTTTTGGKAVRRVVPYVFLILAIAVDIAIIGGGLAGIAKLLGFWGN